MEFVIKDITEVDYGCEDIPDGSALMCRIVLNTEGRTVTREIRDALVTEKHLAIGQVLSEEELKALL